MNTTKNKPMSADNRDIFYAEIQSCHKALRGFGLGPSGRITLEGMSDYSLRATRHRIREALVVAKASGEDRFSDAWVEAEYSWQEWFSAWDWNGLSC